jgi:23S rRNA pseudouridine1911/1915/1917 synthase
MIKKISIKADEAGERIDSILAKRYPDFSRSYFGILAKDKFISVNEKIVKASFRVKEEDNIEVDFQKKDVPDLIPEKIDLNIIYEDDNAIVLNKQPGIVVHPAAGNFHGTIVNALLAYIPKIKEAVYEKGNTVSESRPGLVHRLDKDTSGVMIVAKNDQTMHFLSEQIKDRKVKKSYLALCYGWPKDDHGQIINFLGRHPIDRKIVADIGEEKGRIAISNYQVEKYFTKDKNKVSLIRFDIETGRTHQIRTQANISGFPVLGDEIYNRRESVHLSKELGIKRQLLHAHKLVITLPNKEDTSEFIAPIPDDFKIIIDKLHLEY